MSFPDKPGVYLFKNKAGKVLYVGKAKSLKKRLASYFSSSIDNPKVLKLVSEHHKIDFIIAKNEFEALLLEARLIKRYRPYFNITLKDDKQYPILKLTMNEEWPRIEVVRIKKNDGAVYFGPFFGKAVRDTIREIKRVFPIRWCKKFRKRQQPCLHYYIKNCLSPCTERVSHKDYINLCRALASFLSGDLDQAIDRLKKEMNRAASENKFEAAAKFRDKIKSLKRLMEKQNSGILYKRYEVSWGKEAVLELMESLKLTKEPKRIEAFDISNIQGTNAVGSMVVFENGISKKSDYRKFKIKTLNDRANDVASIYEIVFRRYSKTLKNSLPFPDLVLIDGGIAQVRAAKRAILESGLTDLVVIGIAKREEEIFFPQRNRPVILKKDSPALLLLQRLRDEAHRFAVSYHRIRRRNMLKS